MKKLAFIFAVASLTACGGASDTATEETSMEDSTMVEEIKEEPATMPDSSAMDSTMEEMPMEDSTEVDSTMEEM